MILRQRGTADDLSPLERIESGTDISSALQSKRPSKPRTEAERRKFNCAAFSMELLVQSLFSLAFLALIIFSLGRYKTTHPVLRESAGAVSTSPTNPVSTDAPMEVPPTGVRGFVAAADRASVDRPAYEAVPPAPPGYEALPPAPLAPPPLSSLPAPPAPTLEELDQAVAAARPAVEAMRRTKVDMSTDPSARALTATLQNASLALLRARYGPGPTYTLDVHLTFPESMGGGDSTLVVETAPNWMMPHAVYIFLDAIVTKRGSAAFHRNAGHVLQAFVRATGAKGLAFQEYDARFQHVKYSLGFAGRPGGPEFYISTRDNVENHGPGSQGSKTEADSCFARVAQGFDVVDRMGKQPNTGGMGFVTNKHDFIVIRQVRIRQS
ncbi:hypothetical protein M885DRAFT_470588 [Pelagophyceae sp. CCMP2097]|nr:hypothetical protein M885DRAFT_470588 [Pelagophyceae sp. CCMP2097]